MMERGARRKQPSGSRAGTLTALGLMFVAVGVGFASYMYFLSGSPAPTPAASLATAPVTDAAKEPPAAVGAWQSTRPRAEPVVSPAKAGAQVAEQKAPVLNTPIPIAPAPVAKAITEPTPAPAPVPVTPKLLPAETNPLAQGPAPAPAGSGITVPPSIAAAPKQPVIVASVPKASPPRAETPRAAPATAAAPKKAQPARKAQLVLAVSPAAEVYINGELQGTTPETTTFDLDPGMHRIEIRSGSRKPYLNYVTLEPGDQRRIRHDFDAKPSRPPT